VLHPSLSGRAGVAGLLLVLLLAGCQANPAQMYRTGYDKMLTPQRWAARSPDQAVVIIGGASAVWHKADDPGYAFQNRPRYKLGWTQGYDVALVQPGQYQLQTLVLGSDAFAAFGGISGLGQSASQNYATFTAGAGQVVYVGDFEAQINRLGVDLCIASLFVRNNKAQIGSSFQKNVPYVTGPIATSLITLQQNDIRFPAPCFD
jgi:hypothetical protein